MKWTMSGKAASAKKTGYKSKAKSYKTSAGTRVIMRTTCMPKGVCVVEKMYNKKTKSGVVNVIQTTSYKSSAKKYR